MTIKYVRLNPINTAVWVNDTELLYRIDKDFTYYLNDQIVLKCATIQFNPKVDVITYHQTISDKWLFHGVKVNAKEKAKIIDSLKTHVRTQRHINAMFKRVENTQHDSTIEKIVLTPEDYQIIGTTINYNAGPGITNIIDCSMGSAYNDNPVVLLDITTHLNKQYNNKYSKIFDQISTITQYYVPVKYAKIAIQQIIEVLDQSTATKKEVYTIEDMADIAQFILDYSHLIDIDCEDSQELVESYLIHTYILQNNIHDIIINILNVNGHIK